MLVPTGSVGVLAGIGGTAQGLKDGNIGLGGRVAVDEGFVSFEFAQQLKGKRSRVETGIQSCTECWMCNHLQVLRLLRNTDHGDHHGIEGNRDGERDGGEGHGTYPVT